jgi:hypothetical protein
LVTVLHRKEVRTAVDESQRHSRVSFKSDKQESLKLLDTTPSFVWKDNQLYVERTIEIYGCHLF